MGMLIVDEAESPLGCVAGELSGDHFARCGRWPVVHDDHLKIAPAITVQDKEHLVEGVHDLLILERGVGRIVPYVA
jgi:hypothetical protein